MSYDEEEQKYFTFYKDNFKLFQKLTGYNGADIAEKFNISRQRVSQLKNNHSLFAKAGFYAMLSIMADEKIIELEKNIEDIKVLKKEWSEKLMKRGGVNEHTKKD